MTRPQDYWPDFEQSEGWNIAVELQGSIQIFGLLHENYPYKSEAEAQNDCNALYNTRFGNGLDIWVKDKRRLLGGNLISSNIISFTPIRVK